jgi:hypothetical protein
MLAKNMLGAATFLAPLAASCRKLKSEHLVNLFEKAPEDRTTEEKSAVVVRLQSATAADPMLTHDDDMLVCSTAHLHHIGPGMYPVHRFLPPTDRTKRFYVHVLQGEMSFDLLALGSSPIRLRSARDPMFPFGQGAGTRSNPVVPSSEGPVHPESRICVGRHCVLMATLLLTVRSGWGCACAMDTEINVLWRLTGSDMIKDGLNGWLGRARVKLGGKAPPQRQAAGTLMAGQFAELVPQVRCVTGWAGVRVSVRTHLHTHLLGVCVRACAVIGGVSTCM